MDGDPETTKAQRTKSPVKTSSAASRTGQLFRRNSLSSFHRRRVSHTELAKATMNMAQTVSCVLGHIWARLKTHKA